jgi:hypothetical protein
MYQKKTGDAFVNIQTKHPQFARILELLPNKLFMFVSKESLEELKKEDNILFTDGTFRTTECGLVLTILLVLRGEVGVPCAYLLSDSRETHIYKRFFQV